MAAIYILYSRKINRFYVGSCIDLQQRLQQHESKFFKTEFTVRADDWELFFQLNDLTLIQARAAERYIKSRKSPRFIHSLKMATTEDAMKKLRIDS
jgi:putative endonuclease